MEQCLGFPISSLSDFPLSGPLATESKLCYYLVFVVYAFWWFQAASCSGFQFGGI